MTIGGTRGFVYTALFSGLILVGAYIKIPVGAVPVSLSSFFVLLAGLFLGWRRGITAVTAYLILGAVGLPVFAQGSGLAYLLGPTGGYLVGFLPAAAISGFFSEKAQGRSAQRQNLLLLFGLLCGTLLIYIPGVFWLKQSLSLSFNSALTAGIIPFLPGDALKIAAALALYRAVERYAPDLLLHDNTGKTPHADT